MFTSGKVFIIQFLLSFISYSVSACHIYFTLSKDCSEYKMVNSLIG